MRQISDNLPYALDKMKKTAKKLRNIISTSKSALVPSAAEAVSTTKSAKKKADINSNLLKIQMKVSSKTTKAIRKTKNRQLPVLVKPKLLPQPSGKYNKLEVDLNKEDLNLINTNSTDKFMNSKIAELGNAEKRDSQINETKKLPKPQKKKINGIKKDTAPLKKISKKSDNNKTKKSTLSKVKSVASISVESKKNLNYKNNAKKSNLKNKVVITNELKNLGVVISSNVNKMEANSASAAATAGATAAAAILSSKDTCNPSICEMVKTKSRASVLKSRNSKDLKISGKEDNECLNTPVILNSTPITPATNSPLSTQIVPGPCSTSRTISKIKVKDDSIDKTKKLIKKKTMEIDKTSKTNDKNSKNTSKVNDLVTAVPAANPSTTPSNMLDETSSQQSSMAAEPATSSLMDLPKTIVLTKKKNGNKDSNEANTKGKKLISCSSNMNSDSVSSSNNINLNNKKILNKTKNSKLAVKADDLKDDSVDLITNPVTVKSRDENEMSCDLMASGDLVNRENLSTITPTQGPSEPKKKKYVKKRTFKANLPLLSLEEKSRQKKEAIPKTSEVKENSLEASNSTEKAAKVEKQKKQQPDINGTDQTKWRKICEEMKCKSTALTDSEDEAAAADEPAVAATMMKNKSDAKNRRMKLYGAWSGSRKHRVASLNASAKVHCLYENEFRSTTELPGSADKNRSTVTSSHNEDNDIEDHEDNDDKVEEIKVDSSTKNDEMNSTMRSLRIQPGLRGVGKHWEMDDFSMSSANENKEAPKIKKKKIAPKRNPKKVEKSSPKNTKSKTDPVIYYFSDSTSDEEGPVTIARPKYNKNSKRAEKSEMDGDPKPAVLKKRMASLNASAMMAATFEVDGCMNTDLESSDMDIEISHKSNKGANVKEVQNEVVEVSIHYLFISLVHSIAICILQARPVSTSVVIVQDTDVTITGVYMDSSAGPSQESYCKMQYRVQSSVTEERVVRPKLQQEPPKCYTPLDALSNMGRMLPPGHDQGKNYYY